MSEENTSILTEQGPPAVEVNHLTVRYETEDETVYAVTDISFELPRKKILGLVGETGAGKTTTVRSLLKMVPDPPGVVDSSSEILVNGRNVMKMTETELENMRGKEIAMIFQDPMTALNPVMTVGDQIAEAVLLHEGVDKAGAIDRAREMLRQVGISPDRMGNYAHQFSGGMKQRVVIAIALACHPGILIADEPTTALDVTIQAQVLDLIRSLQELYQTATILVTHDLGVVAETCDYVAVMYNGHIVEYGTLEDIFNKTLHPYTEGLFNALPSIGGPRDRRLVPIEGLAPDPTVQYPGCPFAERCIYAAESCREGGFPEKKYYGDLHYVCCKRYDEPDFHIARGM